MSKAQLVITAVVLEGRSKSEVARDYDVSRYWVQQLVKRYEARPTYPRRSWVQSQRSRRRLRPSCPEPTRRPSFVRQVFNLARVRTGVCGPVFELCQPGPHFQHEYARP
jgi:hypothetical protein